MTHGPDVIERGTAAEWHTPIGEQALYGRSKGMPQAEDTPLDQLNEQLNACMEKREQRRAKAANDVAREDQRLLSIAGIGAAIGFFTWLAWLMATFDSSRNAWFGAGFWAGLLLALMVTAAGFAAKRQNVTSIVEGITRDLNEIDAEIKRLKHQIFKSSVGAGNHMPFSLRLDPFVAKSNATVQLVCAALLVLAVGFGAFTFLPLVPAIPQEPVLRREQRRQMPRPRRWRPSSGGGSTIMAGGWCR